MMTAIVRASLHLWPLVLFGFAFGIVAGAILLPVLRSLQVRQHAYEDAPATHQAKTGTPTMGGVLFLIVAALMFADMTDPLRYAYGLLIFGCGAIGFIDDRLGISKGTNRGLRARTKLLLSALVAVTFLNLADRSYALFPRDVLFHTAAYSLVAPHWLWLLLGIVAVTGTVHAVNLTDGLDGLATGVIVPPLIVFAIIAYPSTLVGVANVLALTTGACLAFLVFNRHPAKMFMGDTGSLTLGAILSGAAILSGEMLLLVIVGAVFLAEALSVMVQVAYFKQTKRRIFRMSPLHHHFELGGMPETQVTLRFWIASALCSLAGLAIVA
ncbi:MAG: phospho-N-acetylmuramoyl-pentapeptide-transferase [Candidatus Eremiobacteraeota bacterium]|nr:phospho-N-acetylmuramoyl-pentapeptide-transferase [Candidatus Eremiobacteraeota bacterium]